MLMWNPTPCRIQFQLGGLPGEKPRQYDIGPGEKVELPDGYCREYKGAGTVYVESVISRIAAGLVPYVAEEAEAPEAPETAAEPKRRKRDS